MVLYIREDEERDMFYALGGSEAKRTTVLPQTLAYSAGRYHRVTIQRGAILQPCQHRGVPFRRRVTSTKGRSSS
jgi:hypothetical protein